MRDIEINLNGDVLVVGIDDIMPPKNAPRASGPDDPNYCVPPEPGHFDIKQVHRDDGAPVSINDSEMLDLVYELVEDELEKEGWEI